MVARRAVSLLEVIVVLAIIGLLIGFSLPAVQRARRAADKAVCLNNLRQISFAVHMNVETTGFHPYARECPVPWKNGTDRECRTVPTPWTYTGPGEVWWAPYDNRPGTTPTKALPEYAPQGSLFGYVEQQPRIFRCPLGIDTDPASPGFGKFFQVSYAMNPAISGRRAAEVGSTWTVMEHDDYPVCGGTPHFVEGQAADPAVGERRHFVNRHANRPLTAFAGGHVQ